MSEIIIIKKNNTKMQKNTIHKVNIVNWNLYFSLNYLDICELNLVNVHST